MADNLQATPRNQLLGLLSDAMYGGLDWMKSPERTQQMQGLAGLLESTGIPQTTQRMAYGEPLTNIGRANVPLLKPETAEAMMNVAPLMPAVGRLASRAVKATEGLPVGMSIKDVGKSAITREGNPIQGAVVLVGDKIFMGRTHGDALNRAVYEGVVRKEGGKYIFPKGAEVNSDLFMTKDGQIIDRLQASKMFDIGASETAIEKGLMQNNPPKSMTVDSYIEQATALKKQREQSLYPQQAALDLAQQRAALPVEQGGLGLPANNTPMDRAKAMGFGTEAFHITPKEFSQFKVGGYDPTLSGEAIWLSPYKDVQPASHNVGGYPNYKEGSRILPLFVKVQKPLVIDDPTSLDWARKVFAGGSREFPQLISPKSAKELQLNNEYKSILFQGEDLGWGNKSNEIMIFNPSDIRSRFAAFDPFRKDVATATAMGVALPDLLAAEPTPEELQRRQSSGLLFP